VARALRRVSVASTVEARRLTEAHRLAQARLGAEAVREMVAAWPLLDLEDLDGTVERWLRVAVPLVQRRREQSAALAGRYYTTFRELEAGAAARFVPTLATLAAPTAVETSLLVTGPVSIKQAMSRGELLDQAADVARSRTAGEAMRHVLAGGRSTITTSVAADPVALGWARVTSGNACAFCRLIASRGPVFSEDTVDFEAHGSCSCSGEPVYRDDAPWPPGAQEYREMWDGAAAELAASEGISRTVAFRRLVEGRA
jgi:hypothetical protein